MEDLRKNVSTESAGNRMELSKETIIDFESGILRMIAEDDYNIRAPRRDPQANRADAVVLRVGSFGSIHA